MVFGGWRILVVAAGAAGVKTGVDAVRTGIPPPTYVHTGRNPWMTRVRDEAAVSRDSVRWYRDTRKVTHIYWCFAADVPMGSSGARPGSDPRAAMRAATLDAEHALADPQAEVPSRLRFHQLADVASDATQCDRVPGGRPSLVVRYGPTADKGGRCAAIPLTGTSNSASITLAGCGVYIWKEPGQPPWSWNGAESVAQQKLDVLHEVGHILGMHHEHSRQDRDANYEGYVVADVWNAITAQAAWKKGWNEASDTMLPFDHRSIMLYESLTPFQGRYGGELYGQYQRPTGFSRYDKLQLQRGYWYHVYEYDHSSRTTYCRPGYHRRSWECVPCSVVNCEEHNKKEAADEDGDGTPCSSRRSSSSAASSSLALAAARKKNRENAGGIEQYMKVLLIVVATVLLVLSLVAALYPRAQRGRRRSARGGRERRVLPY